MCRAWLPNKFGYGPQSTKKVTHEALKTSPGRLSWHTHVSTQLFYTILNVSSSNGNRITASNQGLILSGRRVVEFRRRLITHNLANARCGKRFDAKQP